MISLLWFCFPFPLSAQGTLRDLGENLQGHNIALGCLLARLPIVMLISIVDRNPISEESIREQPNAFLDDVREALVNLYYEIRLIPSMGRTREEFERIKHLPKYSVAFTNTSSMEFSGQGRLR